MALPLPLEAVKNMILKINALKLKLNVEIMD